MAVALLAVAGLLLLLKPLTAPTTPFPPPAQVATPAAAAQVPSPSPIPSPTRQAATSTPSPATATAERSLPSGKPAPDFTLQSAQGVTVALSAYRGKSNVVLVFYRGQT
jgi:hypothetical protein